MKGVMCYLDRCCQALILDVDESYSYRMMILYS